MKYGTVCSGIEAPSVAWEPLGWTPAFFSEIEDFPSAVLAARYPDVPNLGDMNNILQHEEALKADIDVFCGGTPCQSFSIAGLRKGLDDPRGNLALVFLGIVDRLRPRWVVWENVPGVLSSSGGRDFGAFVTGLGQLGYGWSYRVLDAQYFGVPQRRRRVFVVGYLGDWRPAAAVLFERHSLSGNPPPRRETRQTTAADVAPSIVASGRGTERTGESRGQDPVVAHTLKAQYDASEDGTGRGTPIVPSKVIGFSSKDHGGDAMEDCSPTVRAGGHNTSHPNAGTPPAVAFAPEVQQSYIFQTRFARNGRGAPEEEVCPTLNGANSGETSDSRPVLFSIMSMNSGKDYKAREVHVSQPLMAGGHSLGNQGGDCLVHKMAVRRLTPRECERLQGFPDDYTLIDWTSRAASKIESDMVEYFHAAGYSIDAARLMALHPDGHRYKSLGNSMAVPVMRWIGERIELVESITQ